MSLGSKRPTFKPTPYGYTRRSRGIPRWLLLLITGIVLGAGAVLFLQRSYGPQRLTVEQSEQLRTDLNAVNHENQRLSMEIKKSQDQMRQAQKSESAQADQEARWRNQYEQMSAGIGALIDAIPADPRGTSPGIRAADMVVHDGVLDYNALLIQDLAEGTSTAEPLKGEVKFVGSGTYTNGRAASVDIGTQPLDMERFAVVGGEFDLPKGYRPKQVTVQVTADGSDKVIATRTIRVRFQR